MIIHSNTKVNEDLPQKWEEKLEKKLKDRDQEYITTMDQKFEEHVQKLEGKFKILDKMDFFSISKTTLGIFCTVSPTKRNFISL